MSALGHLHLRLFADAPLSRSAKLAAAMAQDLADLGEVQVAQLGRYWTFAGYIEFAVEITLTSNAGSGVADIRAFEPTGWTGDVWSHEPGGQAFLLPEIRWAWLTADDGWPPGELSS
ncbi:hypothetical protein ACQP2X_28905 [Actinoplanes sp. CA-131856]